MNGLDDINRDLRTRFASLSKKNNAHHVLDAVMILMTEYVLDRSQPVKPSFLDEFANLHSMHFLGYSDDEQHESLGLLEDKIALARDSAVAGSRLAMLISADGEETHQNAQ